MSEGTKYPWQEFVLDAFTASSETLRAKIEMAEQAIAARLNSEPPPDADEEIAITDAQNALRVLAPEAGPKPVPGEDKKKKDIA